MILIKSKIYFREITQNEKNIYDQLVNLNNYHHHSFIHNPIFKHHYFLGSGYLKFAYFGFFKLSDSVRDHQPIILTAVRSGNLEIFKFVWKYCELLYGYDDIIASLQYYYYPDIIDFLLSTDRMYTSSKYFYIPSIFNYFCSQKTNICFRRHIFCLLIPAKYAKKSAVTYEFREDKIVKKDMYLFTL